MNSIRAAAVAGGKWSAVGIAGTTALQIVQYLVMARLLDPSAIGLMAMLLFLIAVAQIYADGGLLESIIHFQESSNAVLSTVFWICVASSAIAAAVLFQLTVWLAPLFKMPGLAPLASIGAAALFIGSTGRPLETLLQRRFAMAKLALVDIAAALVSLLAAIALALWLNDVRALAWAYLLLCTVKTLGLALCVLPDWQPSGFSLRGIGSHLRYGAWQLGERTISLVNRRGDQLIVGALLGAPLLGLYNLAYTLVALPISKINPIVTRVALPVFGKLQGEESALESGYVRVVNFLAWINLPLLVGFIIVAPIFVPVVLGDKWADAVLVIQLFAGIMIFRSIGNPIGALLSATGKVHIGFWWGLASGALTLPTVAIAATLGNVEHVVSALLVLQLLLFIPSYLFVLRPAGITSLPRLLQQLVAPAIASLTMAAVTVTLSTIAGNDLTGLVVTIAAGAITYCATAVIFFRPQVREYWQITMNNPL